MKLNFELTNKLIQLKDFIKEVPSPSKDKKSVSDQEEHEKTFSSHRSTPSVSTMPMETKVTTNRSEEASMLRSIASTAHTSKTTVFNSTFKKSIHRVGLRSIVGHNIETIYFLYLSIAMMSTVFVLVRVLMLSQVDTYLEKQTFLIEQETALSYFHRVDLLNSVALKQQANGIPLSVPAGSLFSVKDIGLRYRSAAEEYNRLVYFKFDEIWTEDAKYLLADNNSVKVKLGNVFSRLLSDYNHVKELVPNQYYLPTGLRAKTINVMRMLLSSMGFFMIMQNKLDSLMVVDTNLFIVSLVFCLVFTVALVLVIIGISQKTSDFFNRCSVIFDRIDVDLLSMEATILENALTFDNAIFNKICLFSAARSWRTKRTVNNSSRARKEKENAKVTLDMPRTKKEMNVRIMPLKDN